MISEEKQREIDKRILKVCGHFVCTESTIKEISEQLGIPKSTIQRDLTSERVKVLLGEDVYEEIKRALESNQNEGRSLGGYRSSVHNIPIKDEQGKYIGNKKR